jgi:hypothetical protein
MENYLRRKLCNTEMERKHSARNYRKNNVIEYLLSSVRYDTVIVKFV